MTHKTENPVPLGAVTGSDVGFDLASSDIESDSTHRALQAQKLRTRFGLTSTRARVVAALAYTGARP